MSNDDYMTRLARDLRLRYGGEDHPNVVNEFETETRRVIRERAAFVCLTTPQAVALLMTLAELSEALQFYRTLHR